MTVLGNKNQEEGLRFAAAEIEREGQRDIWMTVEIPFGSHEAATNAHHISLTVARGSLSIGVKTGCHWNKI